MVALKIFLIATFAALANAQGAFRLANYYNDDMVLQMEPKQAVIWGYGDVDARIEINFENSQIVTAVNADGTWRVILNPHAAGGPVNFEIIHNNVDVINLSAWFGDVWVCSGQSNMEMPVRQVFNATEETNKALGYTNIRLLRLNNAFSLDGELDEADYAHGWSAPSTENVPDFSALCLFYGERLSESLGNTRPIGLIDSTWGGTIIEAWFSQRVPIYCLTPPNSNTNQNGESALWNAMIAPLTKTAVRGAIWYQGESNTGYNANLYACHLIALTNDWRQTFVTGGVAAENGVAFPFGVVQIGPYENGDNFAYGALRLHQTADTGILPNPFLGESFMAAAYDLTDPSSPTGDIHPRDKQTVADRLANSAKRLLYGENLKPYGPVPVSNEIVGGVVTITYDSNIKIVGTNGFTIKRSDGSYSAVPIVASTANSVSVDLGGDAVELTYAYRSTVCDYKQCAIYSDDAEELPAQVWKWDLAAIKNNSH